MAFIENDLKVVLEAIEESMSFTGEDIANPSDWNLNVNVSVQELIDKEPEKANTIRYTIKVLEALGYICVIVHIADMCMTNSMSTGKT